MKLFISWSGELSKQLAEALRNWLPATLQYVKPYFTPADIAKGAKWNDVVSKELEAAKVCIITLTRESLDSQWVMFEAGAISRGRAPVCAILFDIEPTDVQGPLESFQATKFSEKEILRLLQTINENAEDRALDPATLNSVFEKWWPDLEKNINQIMHAARSVEKIVRNERSLLEETVALTRTIAADQRELYHLVSISLAASANAARMANALSNYGYVPNLPTLKDVLASSPPMPAGLAGALGLVEKRDVMTAGSGDKPGRDKDKE